MNEQIPNKFKGKGKQGRYCGFRTGHYCNDNCGMFCVGLGSCVFHALNYNLQQLKEELKCLSSK